MEFVTPVTTVIARQRVNNGAALLDRAYPGWSARIDVGALSIESCTRCVLGQSLGGFERGLASLALSGNGADYGFGLHVSDWTDRGDRYETTAEERRTQKRVWRSLQDAWIEAIADRLVPQVPIKKDLPVHVQGARCSTAHCG